METFVSNDEGFVGATEFFIGMSVLCKVFESFLYEVIVTAFQFSG